MRPLRSPKAALEAELDSALHRAARRLDEIRYTADFEGPPEAWYGSPLDPWIPPHSGGPPLLERGVGESLKRFTVDRQPDGTWKLVRERSTTAETFICDDIHDVCDTVLAAYYPDGTPRPWPRKP